MRRLVSALKEHSPIGALTYAAACVSIGSSQLINAIRFKSSVSCAKTGALGSVDVV